MLVERRTRSVAPAMTASEVIGSSQEPSGPVGWRPPTMPPSSGLPYASRSSPKTT